MWDPFAEDAGQGDIVLFDLEFTAWEGSLQRDWSESRERREIIQIGAVRLKDNASFSELDRMVCLVIPKHNPELSDYITDLTGITRQDLAEEGFDFPEALEIFTDFCGGARAVLSYSGDPDVLSENCQIHNLEMPDFTFGELNQVLGKRAGEEFAKSISYNSPKLVGLSLKGQAHDALDDSLAIAETLRVLRVRSVL